MQDESNERTERKKLNQPTVPRPTKKPMAGSNQKNSQQGWLAVLNEQFKRKNRAKRSEDDREARGIQNEHNVGLRRTRASISACDQSRNLKDQVAVLGQSPVLQLKTLNHEPLSLSTNQYKYK
jgi:hypothetical protein